MNDRAATRPGKPEATAKPAETRVVDAQFVAGAVDAQSLPPPTLVEVAFAGRLNVGKSSLLNALMQRRGLARTSNTPGCTRQLNVFEVRCADGLAVRFVDLPGYGWARRSKTERKDWQVMIEGYLRTRVGLRAVAVLADVRRGLEEEESQLVEFLAQKRPVSGGAPPAVILVATKIDKVGAAGKKPAMAKLRQQVAGVGGAGGGSGQSGQSGQSGIVGFSAVTGDGREELWARIRAAVL